MLFDLRSRGRRRTVQGVYLGLAILIGGGLVLFGVGTGSGGGGLLNGLSGSGSNQQGSIISQQVRAAERQVKQNPDSPSAWAALLSARFENASSSGFNSTTNTYTAAGKQQLAGVGTAWQHYSALTKSPTSTMATLAAEAYGALGQYSQAASAWDTATVADPTDVRGFECLAISAYAAKQDREGQLAAARAESMVAKASRSGLAAEINAAKTNPSVIQVCT